MLELLTPPNREPISVSDAKAHARIYADADDSLLCDLISAARQKFETESGYHLSESEYRFTTTAASSIRLPFRPVLSVESITDADENELTAGDDYTVHIDPVTGIGTINLTADVSGDVVITFKVGFANPETDEEDEGTPAHPAPALAKMAIRSLVTYWYGQREAYAEGTLKAVPSSFESIVRNFRLA